MHQEDLLFSDALPDAAMPAADPQLVERLRAGDSETGRRFVRGHYPAIYRYLLYLTGRPEIAEDLTQETFLQAWRRLDTFDAAVPLRPWLHRIAHREFLQALRRQRPQICLEEVGEIAAPGAAAWTEGVELRVLIARLPVEARELVVLRDLEGYTSEEIGRIVGKPAGTVRYQLSAARALLRRELGAGDLPYLNPAPEAVWRRWAWLPLEALIALQARLSRVDGRGLMVDGPPKSTAGLSPSAPSTISHPPSTKGEVTMSDESRAGMSRRKLFEAAGTAAAAAAAASLTGAAAAATQKESEIIDDRLTRKVTLAVKATALSDLCEQLCSETGIQIIAGPSVADEKVTVFCEKLPLREVMRQLSRPFGYTWLRSRQGLGVRGRGLGEGPPDSNAQRPTPNASYCYELVQDLRSQLLEEELRNRDRSAALLALNADIERYRPYLGLSPEEALARAKSASAEDKALLEKLGKYGWGPIQLYFRLSPQEQTAVRAGQELRFRAEPEPGDRQLPPDLERGILACQVKHRLVRRKDGGLDGRSAEDAPDALPLTAVPDIRAQATLKIEESELGQFTLQGWSGFHGGGWDNWAGAGPWATGVSPSVLKPDNAVLTVRLTRDPALQRQVTVEPGVRGQGAGGWEGVATPRSDRATGAAPLTPDPQLLTPEAKRLTSADVLEALHRATGIPIVADFYTRLHSPEAVSVHNQRLYDALNRLADEMRLRWNKESGSRESGAWLEFRSASYYEDRLKEVPNRLLSHWAASRQEREMLTLDDLVEIAGLSDAQLDAADMAEGARECWGLEEWDLARERRLRPHLRFLAGFTPEQRQEAQSAAGLPFTKMPLAQQQQFLALALGNEGSGIQSLQELAGATLRVDYTQPGWFTWRVPGPYWLRFVVPLAPDRRAPFPLIRERTREAALQALRRVDPAIREAAQRAANSSDPRLEAAPPDDEAQIVTTERDLVFLYIPDLTNKRTIHVLWGDSNSNWNPGWSG
jgi:RNA polymerase sigma-70 factor, ECF subfamily